MNNKDILKYKFDGKKKFDISDFKTNDDGGFYSRDDAVDEFVSNLKEINKYQQKLYADRKEGVIFIFQAMDAAGKDGVIRTVFSTLTPHGVHEYCFKAPSATELSHDFLWRFWSALPPRGNISIFNRSYYEDVLIGKVHELYKSQPHPDRLTRLNVINDRYIQIKNFEKYLYNSGTRVVKIFLDVSKDEQARRFISRIDTPSKQWKVSAGDISERNYWDEYMEAFEGMVNSTSHPKSPWYVVPADHKWYARLVVSRIVLDTLKEMDPHFPSMQIMNETEMAELRNKLEESIVDKKKYYVNNTASLFNKTSYVTEGILLDEESQKRIERAKRVKDNSFNVVRDLIAKGYMVKSWTDFIDAIANEKSSQDLIDKQAEEELSKEDEMNKKKQEKAVVEVLKKFDLTPSIKISKDAKIILKKIYKFGPIRLEELCVKLDWRPSVIERHLQKLYNLAFINYDVDPDDENDLGTLSVSDFGEKYLLKNKSQKKTEKKFVDFLYSLNEDEYVEFMNLCGELTEAAPEEALQEEQEERIPQIEIKVEQAMQVAEEEKAEPVMNIVSETKVEPTLEFDTKIDNQND